MPTKDNIASHDANTATIARSLADKLAEYVPTLPEEERALFEHLLLAALPVHERFRFVADSDLLSDRERDLLGCLKKE